MKKRANRGEENKMVMKLLINDGNVAVFGSDPPDTTIPNEEIHRADAVDWATFRRISKRGMDKTEFQNLLSRETFASDGPPGTIGPNDKNSGIGFKKEGVNILDRPIKKEE
jgi:hypothetical protein